MEKEKRNGSGAPAYTRRVPRQYKGEEPRKGILVINYRPGGAENVCAD